jgi:squalene-hopene/tetraprenyl-beta-curcumene cyclase
MWSGSVCWIRRAADVRLGSDTTSESLGLQRSPRRFQNPDGGWGDTIRSRSNISTTAIVWASLSKIAGNEASVVPAIDRSSVWLRHAAGDVTPVALRSAILRRYGKDRTFSVPILTVLALAGKLGEDAKAAWRSVPQLPFELAAVPHAWFQYLRLPVVSDALPALIAIGQVRHHFAPSRNPIARAVRGQVRGVTRRVLRAMQPESGGFLEATPLTSFVVMSMAG